MSNEQPLFRHPSERTLAEASFKDEGIPYTRVEVFPLTATDTSSSAYRLGFCSHQDDWESPTESLAVLETGSCSFIDARFFETHHLPVLERLRQHQPPPIFLNEFGIMATDTRLRPYSALTANIMDRLNLTGSRVLDLGCADGMQSAIAARKRALHLVGVDIHGKYDDTYTLNCLRNSPEPYCKVNFIETDLNANHFPIPQLQSIEVTHVIANIGPHTHYRGAHIAAIHLLRHLPSARVFVGGGYCHHGSIYSPYEAYEELASYGFHPVLEVREAGEDIPRMAFVAVRNNE